MTEQSKNIVGELLSEWVVAAERLKATKDLEMELRKQIVANLFPDPKEGTNTAEVGAGWKVKLKHGYNYKIDQAALESSRDLLEKANISLDDLVNYKPSLREGNYKKLTGRQKGALVDIITISEASPAITLVPPKESK